MPFGWFNARDAVEAGAELADKFPLPTPPAAHESSAKAAPRRAQGEALRDFMRRAAADIHSLKLNFYKKARLANAFKWKLVEKGVEADLAHEATQSLVVSILANSTSASPWIDTPPPASRPDARNAEKLIARAAELHARGAYEEAMVQYQEVLEVQPRNAEIRNNLGAAFSKLGRHDLAAEQFRQAIARKPELAGAHANLGAMLLFQGFTSRAESPLRHALKLKPGDLNARTNLGQALVSLGRLPEARSQLEKVLRVAPRHADALFGMALVARADGRFDEAENLFENALKADPGMSRAWSALVSTRRMTGSDDDWLERAEQMAQNVIAPSEEADLRFAMGKYCDDVGRFEHAFQNYKRANELQKTLALPYDRGMRTRFVKDMILAYTPEALSSVISGTSASTKPVFVVGMPRSGTSLTEQILASHPAVAAAGELEFWSDAMRKHGVLARRGVLAEQVRQNLAERCLQTLTSYSPTAQRIVDKMPGNSDYLGIIHSVFPNARFIYMRRDPIDTCLSCYFQPFHVAVNFSMDLSDLAHHYREHSRLMHHWRQVLPSGSILEVPYEGLIADQEGWTRRILDFLGLEWDARCLSFHQTQRPVVTSSYWQVRQKIYSRSVQRWRHYEKFIGPLLDLPKD
jgi:tetratricopeptide (TPR) repeat protein